MNIYITPKHLWTLSGVFLLAACIMAGVCRLFFSSFEPLVHEDLQPPLSSLSVPIPHSFSQSCTLQEALNSAPFRLAAIDRPVRLPDLRSLLVFYGSNDRPDRSLMSRRFQFGLRGTPVVISLQTGEKLFFKFDTRINRWGISEAPTPLTAFCTPQDPDVRVILEYQDETGSLITAPSEFHAFSLPPTPLPVTAASTHQWLIGSLPVDGSLLERQSAVWWGQDGVVQEFGGAEMAREACRQRVQFGAGENAYVIWVAEGDCFVYDNERWNAADPGPGTIGKPFLKAMSIDGRAIHFQLWNPEGTAHLSVDLIHREAVGEVQVPEIKMIGARSKKLWIAEILGKRLTLTPDDWILLKADGFVKIDTAELLDEYLQGRLSGNLLAFSGIEKVDGELCLIGSFYDCTRTRHDTCAISLYRSWGKKERVADGIAVEDDELDDDVDDDVDDEVMFDEADDEDGDGD